MHGSKEISDDRMSQQNCFADICVTRNVQTHENLHGNRCSDSISSVQHPRQWFQVLQQVALNLQAVITRGELLMSCNASFSEFVQKNHILLLLAFGGLCFQCIIWTWLSLISAPGKDKLWCKIEQKEHSTHKLNRISGNVINSKFKQHH